jgi:hypothetical protein
MRSSNGDKFAATTSQATGFLQADGTVDGRRSGGRRFCVDIFVLLRSVPEIQKQFGWHTYSTLLRSVGTEFKVVQELLRHSTLRSTLDVYTQAITQPVRTWPRQSIEARFEDLSETQDIFHARRVIWPECITPSRRWPEIPPHWPTAQRHLESYRWLMASYVAERLSLASNVLFQQARRDSRSCSKRLPCHALVPRTHRGPQA